jgi:hypothetical protein
MIEQYRKPIPFYQYAPRKSTPINKHSSFSLLNFNLLKAEVLMCTVLDLSGIDDEFTNIVIDPSTEEESRSTRQQILNKWDLFASTSKHATLQRTYNELCSTHENLLISVRQLKRTPNFTVIIKIRSWTSNERAVECINDVVNRANVLHLHVTKYKTAKTGIKELFINLSTPTMTCAEEIVDIVKEYGPQINRFIIKVPVEPVIDLTLKNLVARSDDEEIQETNHGMIDLTNR